MNKELFEKIANTLRRNYQQRRTSFNTSIYVGKYNRKQTVLISRNLGTDKIIEVDGKYYHNIIFDDEVNEISYDKAKELFREELEVMI